MKTKFIKLGVALMLILSASSCSKFLNENPNKSGNDIITEVSQIDLLLNDLTLTKSGGQIWFSTFFASDDCEIRPNLYKVFTGAAERVTLGIWDKQTYSQTYSPGYDWASGWDKLFTINTILEYCDKVTGDKKMIEQLKAEALFYRAFYHSLLMVQYALHPNVDGGATPGIGYRDNTNPKAPLERKDVNYTLSRIIQDLDESEKILKDLGITNFDIKRNWRVSLATVYSLRARIELYIAKNQADYNKAADYAQKALAIYDVLVNYETDPLLQTTDQPLANKPTKKWKRLQLTLDANNTGNFAECYFPFTTFKPSAYIDGIPVSKNFYDTFEENDLRRQKFIDNNYLYVTVPAIPEFLVQNGLDTLDSKSYYKFNYSSGSAFLLGPSTSEMILIKAEALARANNPAAASAELKKLRAKRFNAADIAIANNIGGTLSDVKKERRRELAFSLRWYDLKRYNQIPGEEVTITKKGLSDTYNLTSPVVTYTLSPSSKFYAMPIPEMERQLLGWEQNGD